MGPMMKLISDVLYDGNDGVKEKDGDNEREAGSFSCRFPKHVIILYGRPTIANSTLIIITAL